MAISAPHPAVLHLPTVFRQIGSGEIRIPAFQRSYIWKQSQVTDLLASVREQFPIGSLLMWQVDRKMLEIASRSATSFPDVPELFPTSYVLDGMQRLTTLYGVFHYKDGQDNRLNVLYDLRMKRFFNAEDISDGQSEACVQLPSFMSPRRMLAEQARLASLLDGDDLLEEMLRAQATFQEYLVPVVTIRSDDIQRIVGIFERTNSTGTRLDTVDFMRAITWDQTFDLNEHLETVRETLFDNDIDLPDETVIKCVGLLLDVDPTPDGLLSLRHVDPQRLKEAFTEFIPNIARVAKFLRDSLGLLTFSHVPYEGQTLVAFKAIGMRELPTNVDLDDLTRWFWATGFNESLRGKPDHYVTRAVRNWPGLLSGKIRGLEPRLRLSAVDFAERRMIKGRALSSTFAAMFAASDAVDLSSRERIDASSYLSDTSTTPFDVVFSRAQLRAAQQEGASSRIFANLVVKDVMHEVFHGHVPVLELISALVQDERFDVLASQFITKEAAEAAIICDVQRFLKLRAAAMHAGASLLVEVGTIS